MSELSLILGPHSFAGGKASALVIDVGASQVSVTPVHDGLILKKGVMKSPLAGNFLSSQIRLLFAQSSPPVKLNPYYMVTSKSVVEAGAPSSATYRTFSPPSSAPHTSFRLNEEERVLTEFKESVVQVWAGPGKLGGLDDPATRASSPGRPFEMPDGWNQVFGVERFRVVEGMFDAKAALTVGFVVFVSSPVAYMLLLHVHPTLLICTITNSSSFTPQDADHPAPSPSQTIPALISASIAAVDVDVRPHLLNNIVVTGGSSLLYGFTERLNQELLTLFPGPRVRMTAPGNTSERRFASWIGGSILGSLGTFHQMWISKREYDEHGAGVVEKRCK
jgi:actin-related protein 4